VRHGQTASSARRAYSGRSDIPLTELGREQAGRAGGRLAGAGVDAVCSSPLRRAIDTARAIAHATAAPLTVDERLAEVDYGPLEGLDRDRAGERFGDAYENWRSDPFGSPVPGMEPLDAALERARSATADALAAFERPVLVSHQGTLRLVLVALGEIDPGAYFATQLPEAQPIEIASPALTPA
jgi:probable phosphoglycerate mutase